MTSSTPEALPSFFQRIPLAFGAFFSVLGQPAFAARVIALRLPEAAAPAPAAPPPLKEATPDAALQLLALLQREARLIDFVGKKTWRATTDARDRRRGARGARRLPPRCCASTSAIVPVRTEAEGSRLTLPAGFDARASAPDRQRGRRGAVHRHPEPPRLARRPTCACRSWPNATT